MQYKIKPLSISKIKNGGQPDGIECKNQSCSRDSK